MKVGAIVLHTQRSRKVFFFEPQEAMGKGVLNPFLITFDRLCLSSACLL